MPLYVFDNSVLPSVCKACCEGQTSLCCRALSAMLPWDTSKAQSRILACLLPACLSLPLPWFAGRARCYTRPAAICYASPRGAASHRAGDDLGLQRRKEHLMQPAAAREHCPARPTACVVLMLGCTPCSWCSSLVWQALQAAATAAG
jgi:hypothetical protein